MKSSMSGSVDWGGVSTVSASWHTPLWLLNCLNQSCRWSDLAWLGCETISPGPWGPPTVRPTSLPNPVMQEGSVFIPQITSMPSWEGWSFIVFGGTDCQSVWMLNEFKSRVVKRETEIAVGAVYWQHDYTVSLMWLSLSHCADCSREMSQASHSALIKRH